MSAPRLESVAGMPDFVDAPDAEAGQRPTLEAQRSQARAHLADGAVTAGYGPMRKRVLHLLDEALATELVCMLRYRRHHFMARGVQAKAVADEFLVHAVQEQQHADWLAERIAQLGGSPDFAPDTLVRRSRAQYIEGVVLGDMIRENLVAERIAIDSYRAFIAELGNQDPTTRRLLETILATEEEHADEMAALYQGLVMSASASAPSAH